MGPVLTVGHGTLTAEALVELLRAAGVAHLVDVRSYPGEPAQPAVRTGGDGAVAAGHVTWPSGAAEVAGAGGFGYIEADATTAMARLS